MCKKSMCDVSYDLSVSLKTTWQGKKIQFYTDKTQYGRVQKILVLLYDTPYGKRRPNAIIVGAILYFVYSQHSSFFFFSFHSRSK